MSLVLDDRLRADAAWAQLARRKFRYLLISAFVGLTAYFISSALARGPYESVAVLLLKDGAVEGESVRLRPSSALPIEVEINTAKEVLGSDPVLRAVALDLKLGIDTEFNGITLPGTLGELFGGSANAVQSAIDVSTMLPNLRQAVSVRALPRSRIIQVFARSHDGKKSATLANSVVDNFLRLQAEDRAKRTRERSEWFAAEVGDLQHAVNVASLNAEEFRAASTIFDETSLSVLVAKVKEVRARIGNSTDRTTVKQPAAYGRDTPTASLKKSRSKLEAEIARQSRELIRMQHLDREVEAARRLYDEFLAKWKYVSSWQGGDGIDAEIISYASAPVSDRISSAAVIGLSAALTSALFLTLYRFLQSTNTPTFLTAAEVASFSGVRVISQLRGSSLAAARRVGPTGDQLEFDKLRSSVLAGSVGSSFSAMICGNGGSVPAEFIATGLSSSINRYGSSVAWVVFNNDYYREALRPIEENSAFDPVGGVILPEFAHRFGRSASGLTEIIEVNGKWQESVGARQALALMIKALKEDFDLLLLQPPPVWLCPEISILSQMVDQAYLTVEWGRTTRADLAEAIQQFRDCNVLLDGLVLTGLSSEATYLRRCIVTAAPAAA